MVHRPTLCVNAAMEECAALRDGHGKRSAVIDPYASQLAPAQRRNLPTRYALIESEYDPHPRCLAGSETDGTASLAVVLGGVGATVFSTLI